MGPTLPARIRLIALLAATSVISAMFVAVALPAQADTAPTDGTAATVTSDLLPTAQVNGVVWAQEIVGNTVYVGGSFTESQPAGAAVGVGVVARHNLLAYNLTTGVLISSFAPVVNGQVRDISASPDGSRIYIAGDFDKIDGQTRSRIAAFTTADNSLVAGFRPVLNSSAYAVAVTNSTVYVGGIFTSVSVGGAAVARSRVAGLSATDGSVTGFSPAVPDHTVRALVISPDGAKVVLGGDFLSVNGGTAPGRGLSAVDAATGASLPWKVGQTIYNAGDKAAIWSLNSDGTNVYGTGYVFGSAQTDGNLEGAFNASWTDGSINWIEDCHGDSYSSAVLGDAVYVAGHAHYCANIGGYPQTDPWTFQRAIAFTKAATGTNLGNAIGGNYYNFAGMAAPSLLNWDPEFLTGTFTGQGQAAWSVAASGKYVVYGGEFVGVNNKRQNGLVRFATSDIAPNTDGPRVSGADFVPTAVSRTSGSVRLTWASNWDRDNEDLLYSVVRDGAVIASIPGRSTWWARPTMTYTDTTGTPARSYSYSLRATDPFGNTVTGNAVSVTVSGAGTLSDYGADVLRDGAVDYWRLGDSTGSTAVLDYSVGNDLTASSGVTFRKTGAINGDVDTAATFSGTSTGLASTRTAVTGPSAFAIETWISTTSATGGKIVGFGNANVGTSSNYDRHVYMDASGRVYFGVYPGAMKTVNSAAALNDGTWHHIVASLSSAGMKLFVDGVLAGQRSDVTTAQGYSGYWRIGGDSAWAGDNWFDGTVDEVAIYSNALSASDVAQHWSLSGHGAPLANAAPTAAFSTSLSAASLTVNSAASSDSDGSVVSRSWDFGDGAGATGISTSHTYATSGTYSVKLTVTDEDGATGTVIKKLTVNVPNIAPAASFTTAANGLAASFDGSGSSDSDGTVALRSWNFGDGVTATGTTVSHTYAAAGTYAVVLTVTDDKGATSSTSKQLTVATMNVAPTADFTSSTSGLVASFDGTLSTDSDGIVAGYSWNLGDGTTATGATPSRTYATAGTYSVTLSITDNRGATNAVTKTVTVTEPGAPSGILATDAFGRSAASGLGSSDFGGVWTLGSGATNYSVSGGTGNFITKAGGTLNAYLSSVSSTDTDVKVTASLSQAATGGGAYASVIARRVGTDDYRARAVVSADGSVRISILAGATTLATVKPAGLTYAAGQQLAIRAQVTGTSPTTVRAKVWKVGTSEPAAWQIIATDTTAALQAAGSIGLSSYLSGTSTATTVAFDNLNAATSSPVVVAPNVAPTASFSATASGLSTVFDASASSDSDGTIGSYAWNFGDSTTGNGVNPAHSYAAGGTYTVTLTATDDDGATGTSSQQVTLTAPPATANLASDTFDRSVTGGLGTADLGGTWTVSGGAANFAVGSGLASFATPAGVTLNAYLDSVSSADTEVLTNVVLNQTVTGGGAYVSVIGRRIASDDYRARVVVSSTGAVRVLLMRSTVTLSTTPISGITVVAGSKLHIKLQVTGVSPATIRAKVWADGSVEPAGWTATITDATATMQASGAVGVSSYLSGTATNPVTVTIEDFVARTPQ